MESQITKKNISKNSFLKMLWEHFPSESLSIGRIIQYDELENLLGENRKSNLFRGIIGKWKNEVLEQCGKVIICRINVGYEVADSHQRLAHSDSLQKSGIKKIIKSSIVLDTIAITDLTEDERVQFTKNKNINAALSTSYKRNLEIPTI